LIRVDPFAEQLKVIDEKSIVLLIFIGLLSETIKLAYLSGRLSIALLVPLVRLYISSQIPNGETESLQYSENPVPDEVAQKLPPI